MSPAALSDPRFRLALLAALVLGVFGSAASMSGAVEAFTLEAPEPTLGPWGKYVPYAKEQEAALKAHERARLGVIESMAAPRGLILGLQALAGLLLFLGAAQIRWNPEPPWVGLADRLAWVARGMAVLRTLDGAQQLVIARRAAEAAGKTLEQLQVPEAAAAGDINRAVATVASVGWTVLVVAALVGLGAYFRSPRVQTSHFVPDAPE